MRAGAVCVLIVLTAIAGGALGGKAGKSRKKPAIAAAPPAAAVFDNPEALDGFFAALAATEDGTAPHAVRISYLGDSLVADDHMADRLRTVLGKRFGDGGPGFVHIVALPSGRNRNLKRVVATGGWRIHGIARPMPADRLLGYAGSSAESKGSGKAKLIPLGKTVTSAEVYYLTQPGGGTLEILINGKLADTVKTGGKDKKAGFARVASGSPLAKVELRTAGKVRLFGVAMEASRGIVVDNLGVKNATAKGWGRNGRGHWRGQLQHRDPDLFIVMIGSNEAGWLAGKSLAGYQQVIEELLAPVRAGAPGASCLVISPPDQVDYQRSKLPQRKSIVPMVEAQRKAAAVAGCAFWDLHAWMGGPRSSLTWFKRRWMSNDFAHPTAAGARRIADGLAAGLLDGYARYR